MQLDFFCRVPLIPPLFSLFGTRACSWYNDIVYCHSSLISSQVFLSWFGYLISPICFSSLLQITPTGLGDLGIIWYCKVESVSLRSNVLFCLSTKNTINTGLCFQINSFSSFNSHQMTTSCDPIYSASWLAWKVELNFTVPSQVFHCNYILLNVHMHCGKFKVFSPPNISGYQLLSSSNKCTIHRQHYTFKVCSFQESQKFLGINFFPPQV
jgi:hypothetical protein